MSVSKLLSLLVVALYLFVIYLGGKSISGFKSLVGISFVLGLPCIWFSDALGNMLGFMGHSRINTRTPESIVRFVGWLLLLFLPIFGYILLKYAI